MSGLKSLGEPLSVTIIIKEFVLEIWEFYGHPFTCKNPRQCSLKWFLQSDAEEVQLVFLKCTFWPCKMTCISFIA